MTTPWWPPVVLGEYVVPVWLPFVLGVGACVVPTFTMLRTWRTRLGRTALVFAVLLLPGLWIGFDTLTTQATVLPTHGPDGCRVISREHSFLFAGRGQLGTIATPIGFGHMQASYSVDDGAIPIRNGNYTLRWDSSGPTIQIAESMPDPESPEMLLRC